MHDSFLPVAARHMQNVELRRLGERCVGQQAQPLHVAHGIERLGVDARRAIGQAGENLERTGQIGLIEPLERQKADFQVNVVADHGDHSPHPAALKRPNQSRKKPYRGILPGS